jgi:fucose permease
MSVERSDGRSVLRQATVLSAHFSAAKTVWLGPAIRPGRINSYNLMIEGISLVTKTFQRDGFTWLAYLLLAFYAYYLNILGPITPFLKEELNLSYTVSSLHFTAFAVGILLVGLASHVVIEQAGRWRSLWIGAAGMSLSALLLIAGKNPIITIGASFLMGLIGSFILAIVPSALTDQHGEQKAIALSEANVIASLIATGAPLMVGWFAPLPGGWRMALALVALSPFLMGLVFRKANPMKTPGIAKFSQYQQPAKRALPRLYWVYWVAIVLAVSVEFCMISWSASYLENVLGMVKVEAARSVSVFLAAMIIGRLASSRLVDHFTTPKLVIASTLLAGGGFLVYWLAGNVLLVLIGLFVTGLGVASLYPLILSLAMGSAEDSTVQASARATLASGAAILTLPFVMGRLADAAGIRPAYGIVLLLLASVLIIVGVATALHQIDFPVKPHQIKRTGHPRRK